ncbi:MAG TPA: sialidase family protein, partial [Candidatus Synoicihabitans sp.]|nr:sialidase family protein [Candidatus Synoicihabitans sp.]
MAISAVASRASTELPYSWRSIALGGGGFVTGVVYHLNAPGLVYARTDVGGAYRWDGPTSRWVALNDDLGRDDAQLTGVVSLAVDPHDPDRLYLACGQYLPSWGRTGAVLRSVDRGATWQRTELSIRFGGNADGRSTGERLQVDPHEGRILFLGSHQDGLWRSADRGVTWTRVAGFSGTHVTFVLPDRRSGNLNTATTTWYAGTAAAGGGNLWRSTDGGSTWNAVPGQPAGLIPHHADFDYRDDGKLYLAYSNGLGPNGVTAGAVWKLDPSTGGWTQLPVPTGQGGFAGVSVDAQRAGVVVVSTLNRWAPGDEVYRTTDGGATWRPLLSGSTYDRSAGPWSVARSPHWIGDVDINPHNSDEAMFITGYGIWATSNLTASEQNQSPQWSFRNQELEETVPLDLVSPPQGAPLIVAYGDIGVFRHADPRVTPPLSDYFATHRTTTRSLAIAAQAPQILARLHHDGTRGAYTLDGGLTHHDFATAPSTAATNGPGAIAVSADGARFLWMPERSVAYVSSNRGGSWTASAGGPGGGTTSFRPAADAVDANTFYIYDSVAGRVAVSRDGGVSFSAGATGLPSGGAWLKAVPGRAGQVWLPAEAGGLYRSIDYG